MRYVFLGAPGAGKGTQAQRFAALHGLVHISTGDMLRRAITLGTAAGLKAKPIMARGELVPDSVVLEMVGERIAEPDAKVGFILDGYPRNVSQAKDLEKLLATHGTRLDGVIAFEIDEAVVVARLSGRRWSPSSGKTYHVTEHPPKVPGRCDVDGSELVQREDDKENVIRDRLTTYREKTAPLIAFYTERGLLRRLDAMGSVEAVGGRLEAAVGASRRS